MALNQSNDSEVDLVAALAAAAICLPCLFVPQHCYMWVVLIGTALWTTELSHKHYAH